MTEYIGDIEFGAFSQLLPTTSGPVEENDYLGLEDPVVVEMERDLEDLTVRPLLDERLHSTGASISLQRENMYGMLKTDAGENTIDKMDWRGWFEPRNAFIQRPGTYTTGQIVGEYYPYGDFRGGKWINREVTGNEFALEHPGIFVFPQSLTNFEVWSKTEGADLTAISSLDTEDGSVDRFSLWSYFNPDEQTASSFGFREEFAWVREAQLSSQGDSVSTTGISVPDGKYKIKARLSDSNISDDVLLLQGSNTVSTVTTGTTDITVVESAEFSASGSIDISVEKGTTDSNTIRVDGYWLEPVYRPAAMYDIDLSGDFHAPMNISPVRVFDGDHQIHNVEHTFSGALTVQNGILQLDFGEGGINVWRDGSYQNFINLGSRALDFRQWSITELGPERVEIYGRLEDGDGDLWMARFQLDRGAPTFRVDVEQSNTSGVSYVELDNTYTHAASIGKVFSEGQHSGSESIPDTDCWASGIADDHIGIFASSATTLDEFYFDSQISRVGYTINEGDTLYFGAYSFSDGDHLTETSITNNNYEYEAGTDLGHGAYLIGWRIKSDGGEDVTITVERDGNDVSVDDKGASWTTATTTSYKYYLRYYETDTDGTFSSEVSSSNQSAIDVDEVVLLPVALGSGVGAQDTSHELLTKLDSKPTVQQR